MMFLRGAKSWFLVLLLRLHCTAQSCMKGETAKRCMEGEMTLRCMEGDAAMHCMQRETAMRCMKREKAMDCMEEHERMMETQDENTVLRLPEPPKINDNIHSNRLPQRFLSWSSPLFYKELPRNLTTPKMENNHLCLHYQTCSFVNGRFKLRQYNTSRIRITLKCPLKIAVRPVVNLTCIKQHRIRAGLCGCCDKNGYGAWSFAVKATSGLLSSGTRGSINASGEIGDVCNTVPELNVTCNISDTAMLICTWPSAVQTNTSNVASKLMYRWKTEENKLWEECKEYIQETGFEISGCVWHNVSYSNKLKLDVQIPHFLPYHETFKLETKYTPEPPSRLWLELKDGKPDDVCRSSNNTVEVDVIAERKHKRESDIGGTMKAEAEDWEVAILCWKPPVLSNEDYVYEVNITPKDGGNKQSFRKRDGVGVWIKPFNPRRSYILSVRRKRQLLNDWSAWVSIEYNVVNDAGQKWWWQKLILAALALIILCGLFILTIHVSRHKLLRLKTKLWPDIPDPSHLLNHFSTLIGTEPRAHDHLGSELASTKSELTHFIEELKENVLTNTHPSLKAPLQNELVEPYVPEQDREEKAPDVLGETDKKPITIDLPSSVCLKAGNLQYCLLESMYVDTQGETILTCFGKNTDNIVTRLIPIEPT